MIWRANQLSPARAFIAILLAVASGHALAAQGAQSPFLPPGYGSKAAPPPAASPLDSYEFRGVLTLDDKTFITLFDKGSSRSFTAVVGETVNNVTVAEYRLKGDDDVVVLESGGVRRDLTLAKAKIIALAVPPPTAVPLPQAGQPPLPGTVTTPGQPAVNPGMSDEEVRQRMQKVAEEIRRRRAVRREMLENTPPP